MQQENKELAEQLDKATSLIEKLKGSLPVTAT